jgi:uncharacterized membrane protein YdbT with pleckstrin-like domain
MISEFTGEREGEKVVFIFRRHIMVARKGLLWFLVLAALGCVPMVIWPEEGKMFFAWLGFILVGIMGWLYAYVLWYFSVYIVTNERIRQVSQKGLFKKTVVDLDLVKIESISYNVPGLFGSMFGYGTILIQTMVGDMVVSNVAKPEMVYNKLQDVVGKAKK